MIPTIEAEFSRAENLLSDEHARETFLNSYLDLMRTVNGLHETFDHNDS